MKKRIVSLLMALCLICVCSVSVFAADGLDLSVLRNGKDIQYSENNQSGMAAYVLRSVAINETDIFYSNDGSSISFTPAILAIKDGSTAIYNFNIKFTSNRFLNLKQVIFVIGEKSYIFYNIPTTRKYPNNTSSGMYEEETLLALDDGSIQIINDIIDNRNAKGDPVKIIVEGANESFNLTLSNELTDGMIHLYNLFVEAGGTSKDNLYLFPKELLSSWQSSNE